MEEKRISKEMIVNKEQKQTSESVRFNIIMTISLFFIISFLYLLLFGNHIFFYQDNLNLFVFSREYLYQFAVKPGGLLEYAGNFIAQSYFSPVYGSIILSAIFVVMAIVFLKITGIIYSKGPFIIFFAVLPSCILLLFQTNFNFLVNYSLGFLLVAFYFLLMINSKKRILNFLLLALFPLFYYLVGGYVWIFTGMYLIYSFACKEIIYPVILILVASLTLILFKNVIFLQPFDQFILYPLPPVDYFKKPLFLYGLFSLIIVYPALLKTIRLIKIREEYVSTLQVYSVLLLFAATIYSQSRLYKPEIADLFKLEKFFYKSDWDGVIKFQEEIQSKNMIAQYYYNTSLAEKNLLCDRLFFGSQDYGTKSLMVQWDSKMSKYQIFRGAYFFYTIGLINEAHRWAFESMVIQGYRPENIVLLIKTELINGNYQVAEKYINVLKKTIRFKALARKYEKMLYHPELVRSDSELGEKMLLMPREDFWVRLKNQQNNIPLLLKSNSGNKKAYEYLMAWYMLERNPEKVAEEIKRMKDIGYSHIPRHIEEAALYLKSVSGVTPDLGGLKISSETENRFLQYLSSSKQPDFSPSTGETKIKKAFGNTFWFYNEFK